jgi:hypothetical protein
MASNATPPEIPPQQHGGADGVAENLAVGESSWQDRILDPKVSLEGALIELGLDKLDSQARLGLIEQARLSDYQAAIDIVHRKVASEHSHEAHPESVKLEDPHTGEVRHRAAHPAMRSDILRKALENSQALVAKYRHEGGDVDEVLQRCGNLAAFGIVLAHIYKDGNGRTARTIGELVHNGFNSTDPHSVDDLRLASTNRPDTGFRINSYVPTGGWAERASEEPFAFLDAVAAFDQPFDGQSYIVATEGQFTTPRM